MFNIGTSTVCGIDNGYIWTCVTGLKSKKPKVDVKANRQQVMQDLINNDKYRAKIAEFLKKRSDTQNEKYQGCHVWTGHVGIGGYGEASLNRVKIQAHQVAWILANKQEIPDLHVVRHGKGCSKACANPAHLTTGTRKENSHDRYRDGTVPLGSRHPNAVLTEDEVRALKKSKGTATIQERAAQFNVSHRVVACIDSGGSWAWLKV